MSNLSTGDRPSVHGPRVGPGCSVDGTTNLGVPGVWLDSLRTHQIDTVPVLTNIATQGLTNVGKYETTDQVLRATYAASSPPNRYRRHTQRHPLLLAVAGW